MIIAIDRASRIYDLAQRNDLAGARTALAEFLAVSSTGDRNIAMFAWIDRTAGVLGLVPGQPVEMDLAEDGSADVIHPDLARDSLAWTMHLFQARAIRNRGMVRDLLAILDNEGVDVEKYLYELVTSMAKTAVAVAEEREVNGHNDARTCHGWCTHFDRHPIETAARRAVAIMN